MPVYLSMEYNRKQPTQNVGRWQYFVKSIRTLERNEWKKKVHECSGRRSPKTYI